MSAARCWILVRVRQGIMADLSPQRSLGVESVVMGPVGVAQAREGQCAAGVGDLFVACG
jgi:hypothetical protein